MRIHKYNALTGRNEIQFEIKSPFFLSFFLIFLLFFIFFCLTCLLEEARAEIRASLLVSIEARDFLIIQIEELEHSKKFVIKKIAELDQYSSNSASTWFRQGVHQIFGQISYEREKVAIFTGFGLFLHLIINLGYDINVAEAVNRALHKFSDPLAGTFRQNLSTNREVLVDVLENITNKTQEFSTKLDIIIPEVAELETILNGIEMLLESSTLICFFLFIFMVLLEFFPRFEPIKNNNKIFEIKKKIEK